MNSSNVIGNLSGQPLGEPLYRSQRALSVTSLCQLVPLPTLVYLCPASGHLQTAEIPNIDSYYDQEYRILIESEDEDQLYDAGDGRRIYRTQHQVETLDIKLEQHAVRLGDAACVLDYGCAKASTLRRWMEKHPQVRGHVFDVSEMYRPFWDQFLAREAQAVYQAPPSWHERFDVVTSFYALEHVAQPLEVLCNINRLLKPGGIFYCLVPNTYSNIADFVVVDHVNHFSPASWRYALTRAGFETLEIDEASHHSALIVTARKSADVSGAPLDAPPLDSDPRDALHRQCQEMATYWNEFASRVTEFEDRQDKARVAIYGSGFYGTFIATALQHFDRVSCFLDQNPFRQHRTLLERPILSPAELPNDITTIYVGLNPAHAQAAMENLEVWRNRSHTYFFA